MTAPQAGGGQPHFRSSSDYPKIDYWSFRIIGLVIAACENALEMLVGKALYQKTALDVELDATFAGRLV